MFEGISGHKKQLQLLDRALQTGKLAHAYVFAGPEGVGKKLVAQELAKALLENPRSTWHPDLLMIERREDKSEIIIEQIRELVYKLSLKPYQAKYKVAIIESAEQLNDAAANALLKVLEEPTDYTYLFLITSNPNRLPKTILSRCQKINFGPIDLPLADTEETRRAEEFLAIFTKRKLVDRLLAAYDIAELETEEIKKMFDIWLARLQKQLQIEASKSLAGKIGQVMLSRKYLEGNVNSKLLLTNLMLNT